MTVAPATPTPARNAPAIPAQPNAQARPAAPLPFVITNTKRTERFIKAMVYGPYGVGKTTLAASAANVPFMRDVFMIDAESGDMSLSELDDVDRVQISRWKQLGAIYEYLKQHCAARDAYLRGDESAKDTLRRMEAKMKQLGDDLPDEPHLYRTLVIDSLSELSNYAMYQLTGRQVGVGDISADPTAATFKEWGQSGEMVRYLVRSLRDLPMHVIFVAAERTDEENINNRMVTVRRPKFPGQLANDVQGLIDIVAYMNRTTEPPETPGGRPVTNRQLLLEGNANIAAKHRIVGLSQPVLHNPTMADLVRLALPNRAS